MFRYKKIIQWGAAFCCLVYIVWFFRQNSHELVRLSYLRPLSLVGLAGLFVLGHIIYSYRFLIVLKKCSGRSIPLWAWFKIVVLGRFLSTFAPQAGNIYRSVLLKKKYQITYTRYASSFFSFNWLDTCVNIIFATVIILVMQPDLRLGSFVALYFLAALFVLIAVVPLLLETVFRLITFRNRWIAWLHGKLSEMLTVSVGNLTDTSYLLKIILSGVFSLVNTVAIFYLFFLGLDLDVNLPVLVLFYVVLKLSNQIIITPGNLGVREIAYGILSEQMQIGMAEGMLIALCVRLMGTSILIILAGLFGGSELLKPCEKKS